MDRHNMMLFLQQDTAKVNPVGFERPRRNLFDPDDDDMKGPQLVDSSDESIGEANEEDDESEGRQRCIRDRCRNKPRFDSLFCSDSCGLSALEQGLLRSMECGGDIHPSLLRS